MGMPCHTGTPLHDACALASGGPLGRPGLAALAGIAPVASGERLRRRAPFAPCRRPVASCMPQYDAAATSPRTRPRDPRHDARGAHGRARGGPCGAAAPEAPRRAARKARGARGVHGPASGPRGHGARMGQGGGGCGAAAPAPPWRLDSGAGVRWRCRRIAAPVAGRLVQLDGGAVVAGATASGARRGRPAGHAPSAPRWLPGRRLRRLPQPHGVSCHAPVVGVGRPEPSVRLPPEQLRQHQRGLRQGRVAGVLRHLGKEQLRCPRDLAILLAQLQRLPRVDRGGRGL
mmetsp:Transcript_75542/g.211751  ORF Transcript_75542/g.211751 Transcript_75542/m.211751 type:complete len:288 (-) Transcript_75542:204-1067(-)